MQSLILQQQRTTSSLVKKGFFEKPMCHCDAGKEIEGSAAQRQGKMCPRDHKGY